ncbi:MAG: sensor histidine kinase, partial [Chitinophagaceae bacterium]
YSLNRNISFLYYSGYAFFLGLMFFLIAFTFREPSRFAYFFEEYLDFVLHSIGTFFYLVFLRKFLDSKKVYPGIHKLLVVEQLSIIVSFTFYSWAYFFTDNFHLQFKIEVLTKFFWMAITIMFIILAIRKRNTLLDYLAIGHAILIFFASISFYFILFNPPFRNHLPEVFGSALFYFETGVCIELVFFLAALASKNKRDVIDRTKESERLKIKSERQEMEQQLAVFSAKQEERNRISADMHDELGSGLTAIRLMSEIVKQKMKPATLPEIDRISNSANELINKSNALIWTMKSDNDTLESLVAYIRTYTLEFFESTSIHCTVKMPNTIRAIELNGEKRRNIFLTVKETLNNTLKHSKAQTMQMVFEVSEELTIRITDDGVGIDFENLRQFGSGLKNMKQRIEGIGGRYSIQNNDNGGVTTLIELAI